jgi:hypothetical protein
MICKTIPAAILLAVAALAGCASSGPSSPATAHPASSAPAAASQPPAGGQEYASDMRNTFNFGSGISDSDLASSGQQICIDLQGGNSVATEALSQQSNWSNTSGGDALQMVLLAEQDMCPGQQGRQTVTYIVTGTPGADVTYGTASSNYQGAVPMKVTRHLGHPQYYSINAQLNGGGTVRCKIKVDGVTIATGSASGGYNIASCEADQNITTGSWEDTNS